MNKITIIYVVSILSARGNEYVPYSHREFSSYKDAIAYKQHMQARGHLCKMTSTG